MAELPPPTLPPAEDDSPLRLLLNSLQSSRAQDLLRRIDELRALLVRWAIVMLVLVGVGFYYAQDIFALLKIPLAAALPQQANVLHFTGPLEVMLAYMKVAFLLALVVATPLVLYQTWRFIGPALPEAQRRYVIPFFLSSLGLFIFGALFAYFAMLPMGLKWLMGFGAGQAEAVITVSEYVDMLTLMLVGFGLAFQLPIAIILVERLGLIEEQTLVKNRGWAVVSVLIAAAIIAPSPDPVSMLSLAAPMYVMFEGALLVIHWMKKGDKNSREVKKA